MVSAPANDPHGGSENSSIAPQNVPLPDSTAVTPTAATFKREKVGPVGSKPLNDKQPSKTNMTVETETVNTKSHQVLPIGNEIVTNSNHNKKEKVTGDDSEETFLYDNGTTPKREVSQVQSQALQGQQQQAQSSQIQLAQAQHPAVVPQQMQPPMSSPAVANSAAMGGTSGTNSGNTNNNATISSMTSQNAPFVSGHSVKQIGNMKKPRYTQRNGSFNSLHQGTLMGMLSSPGGASGSQGTTNGGELSNDASTEFTLTNGLPAQHGVVDRYSDNEEFDEFDSSTYDVRSQISSTNKSAASPVATKKSFGSGRRVVSANAASVGLGGIKPLHPASNAKNKSYSTLPASNGNATKTSTTTNAANDEQPPLRTITSKLFDSTGMQPRRYSGLPHNIDFDDFDDDDFDDYGFDFHHKFGSQNPNQQHQHQNFQPGVVEGDNSNEFTRFGTAGFSRKNNAGNYGAINDYGGYGGINSASNDHNNNTTNSPNIGRLKRLTKRNKDLFYSPHDFPNSRQLRWKQITNFCYSFLAILVLLSLGFISGFLLASTKDLQAVKIVDATEILVSDEELVFNLIFDGFNPGFMNIEITNVELEIFAKSSHVHDGQGDGDDGDDDLGGGGTGNHYAAFSNDNLFETVLLGGVSHLEIPLKFQGGFFTRQKNIAITEIKIVNPCSNEPDENKPTSTVTTTTTATSTTSSISTDIVAAKAEQAPANPARKKWHNISQHPFDLIVRGVLNYELPILKEYRTVGVNKIVRVSPDNLEF